ncbi:MAG: rod shape-determining protein MreC [Gemmatimonadetes bacterium]|nr:rod shape-determining protein MreC [Gemmatimonadota bacterium]
MPAYTTDTEGTAGRRQILVALVFLGLALALTYLPPGQQQGIASALRVSLLRPFVATQEGLVATRERAIDSRHLRSQHDSLVAVMSAHHTTVEENRRLRALLSLQGRVGPSYRPATVIRAGTAGSESMFLLNVGEDDGVRAEAPVITRHGLLGVVRQVRGGTAIGMDWTHPDFRASAMTLDGTAYGIVESRRGDFREGDRLVLNGTAFHTTLDEGTIVLTSGLGVYPRGIPIGTVEQMAEAEAGWRKSYFLRPLVDPGGATHVLVATVSEEGGASPGDLTSAWPQDSIVSYEAMAEWDQARRDSLAALGDSVLILRQLLLAYQGQDSAVLAAMDQAQRDSVARAARAAVAAGVRPPSQEQPAAEGGAVPTRQAPARTEPAGEEREAPAPQPQIPRADAPPVQPRQPPRTDTVRRGVIRPAVPPPDTADTTRPAFPRPTDTIQVGGGARPDTTRPPPDTMRPPPDTMRPPPDTLGAAPREGQGGAPST